MQFLNKKLLIISSYAPPMVGGPQNLFRLFSQLPKDSFSILTSSSIIQDAQKSKVSGDWLPCKYFFYDSKQTTSGANNKKLNVNYNFASLKKAGKKIKKIPGVDVIYDLLAATYLLIANIRKAISIITHEKTNMLIGVSDSGHSLITTYIVSKIMKIPYTLFLFDLYYGSNLKQPHKLIALFFEPILIKNASKVIVTNEATKDYYENRYGRKIKTVVIYNSVFIETYAKFIKPFLLLQPYKIVFTGNVFSEQEQSILNLVKSMDLMLDISLDLFLYIPKPTKKIFQAILNKKNIKLLSANQSEMPKIQSQATLLFLPLAWGTKTPEIIATATPGKFSDYLASGRPILVHAPEYAYISQLTRRRDLGLVVDQNNIHLLAKTIREFLSDPSKGKIYTDNSLRFFHDNFDARKNAVKLIELLNLL